MVSEFYSKSCDIISVNFGEIEHSRELKNANIVLDFDKEDNIVGIEIFDFKKKMKESQEFIDSIFRKRDSHLSRKVKHG